MTIMPIKISTAQLIVFILGSIGFILLSRQAFLNLRSHGFPRFFAFEAILGLVVLNAPYWLVRPFSLIHIISWLLLLASIYPVVHAVWILRRLGHPDRAIQDTNRLAFEKTTRLVTVGPYRYIRHPMYASLLYFAWGIFLKQINLMSALLAIIASLALFLTAVYEEQENLRNFGDEYAIYMRKTKRFAPYVF